MSEALLFLIGGYLVGQTLIYLVWWIVNNWPIKRISRGEYFRRNREVENDLQHRRHDEN